MDFSSRVRHESGHPDPRAACQEDLHVSASSLPVVSACNSSPRFLHPQASSETFHTLASDLSHAYTISMGEWLIKKEKLLKWIFAEYCLSMSFFSF